MTFIVADRVQETTNSPGTGTATLLGAVSGYQSFSTGIGANNTTFYVIADQLGTNWEVGLGALNSTGTVLTRTTVYSSSNGGSTVNFATGTQYVWCDYPSSKAVIQGTAVNFSSIGATTAGTGAFTTLSASSTVSGTGFTNYFAAPPTIGNTTPNAGAFTTLSASSTVSGTGFSTYLASPPAIGGTTAAAGSFTTLSASSTVSGTGFSTYLASPPAIGGTAAAAGTFTTLSASSTVSGTGFSNYFAAPPTIGNTTPNSGNFTAVTTNQLTIGTTQLGAGNASIMKNRIINGAMVVNQRNASVTSSSYTVDRFAYQASQTSKFTVAQSSTSPTGFINSLSATSSSAYSVLTGDYFTIYQNIEGYNVADLGWGTANAKTVTLSFQVYSSLTGTFGGAIQNGNGTRSYPFSYSIPVSNTWTLISIIVAGDTTGTWTTTNGIGLQIGFSLGTGATYNGTAGAWVSANYVSATGAVSVVGTSGATFYITGVQLEVGSSATGYEYRQYQQELALCQRYFASYNSSAINTATGIGYIGNTTTGLALYKLPVTPRIAPTGITINGAFNFSGISNFAVSALTFSSASPSGDIGMLFTSSGMTAGQSGFLQTNATSNYIQFTGFEL